MQPSGLTASALGAVAQVDRTQTEVFDLVYLTFLVLGTIVGIVVMSYILYNAWKYRTDASPEDGEYDIDPETADTDDTKDVARPEIGIVPSQAGGSTGKKVFLSFAISAIIVLALVIFAYANLLYVEDIGAEPSDGGGLNDSADALDVTVTGQQFFWQYTYPSGETFDSQLVVPVDRPIALNVTSCHPEECDGDVWHNWGSPDLRARADAIPGQYTDTWFQADEPGNYTVICYELCGSGHSNMRGEDIEVVSQSEFRTWCEDNDCMAEDDLDNWLDAGENQ